MFTKRKKSSQAGASLIEVAITILILVVVMGAVFSQIDNVTRQTKRESIAVDLVQQNRDFVDLFVRDMHMTGYPHLAMYGTAPSAACNGALSNGVLISPPPARPQCDKSVSTGIVAVSPTSIRLEGDVYGDGNIYSVLYTYYCAASTSPCAGAVDPYTPPDPNCPCLRRSAILKISADPVSGQNQPQYYTEVQNVIDPSNMTQGIFTFFDSNGNVVNIGTGADFENNFLTIQSIDAIKVNLNVRSIQKDLQNGSQVVYSLASIAELEN
jgi:hypothetical protein